MSKPSLENLKAVFEEALIKSVTLKKCHGVFASKRLNQAMKYALGSQGKRVRPLLVLATALAQRGDENYLSTIKNAMPAALAVEYVHTYSLIHDDLPAMDNDDYRRNKASTHRQFNEAQAILAGDALLADAFFFAAGAKNNPGPLCRELAKAAGSYGLPAGQCEDLLTNDSLGQQDAWLRINQAKTARLFEASSVMGALSAGASAKDIELWRECGHNFGVAFQLRDDALDSAGAFKQFDAQELKAMMLGHVAQANEVVVKFTNNVALLELSASIFG